jgi:hypothetical protein
MNDPRTRNGYYIARVRVSKLRHPTCHKRVTGLYHDVGDSILARHIPRGRRRRACHPSSESLSHYIPRKWDEKYSRAGAESCTDETNPPAVHW